MTRDVSRFSLYYVEAKERLLAQGFAAELDWQESRSIKLLTESEFLRQSAWVVLSSGFRTAVVARLFPAVEAAFLGWRSAAEITKHSDDCKAKAYRVFRNDKKLSAICAISERVASTGFESVKQHIQSSCQSFLVSLPYIGPVTSLHLMKNIGLNVAKPDRHLLRIARLAGYDSPQELCARISDFVGDGVAEVDYVLWKSSTVDPDFANIFQV